MSILHILLDLHKFDLHFPLSYWIEPNLDCVKKKRLLHKLLGLQHQVFCRHSSMTSNLV
ncbi:LOW QUALITY PROTEIN: hypothetical protein BT93_C1936 [Corymbia citriodora subsp. variegata]|nr:LOW QUALITY PROTEIN: hypothetical protein BT93_C1936 [Corymbia citriodora subsp. variegata]